MNVLSTFLKYCFEVFKDNILPENRVSKLLFLIEVNFRKDSRESTHGTFKALATQVDILLHV